jgi:phosphate starvation-inducible PhoH-like protein
MGNARRSDHRTKAENREARKSRQPKSGYGSVVPVNSQRFKIKGITDNQNTLLATIKAQTLTFVSGPAGCGKSFCALGVGCELMLDRKIDMIVCLKPSQEIDSELGTLPGDKNEKLDVLYNPMKQILIKNLGRSHFENLFRMEKILFEPLGSILGMTYDNALIVIDESQHSTPMQMKILLTRLGKNSRVVVCGDFKEQKITPGISGMEDALKRLRNKKGVGVVELTADDIVRSDFTREVILAYRETEDD